jgi:hypothetical protein
MTKPKSSFHGRRASSLDATACAFLANILVPPFHSPLKTHAMSLGNLDSYCEHMNEQHYGR